MEGFISGFSSIPILYVSPQAHCFDYCSSVLRFEIGLSSLTQDISESLCCMTLDAGTGCKSYCLAIYQILIQLICFLVFLFKNKIRVEALLFSSALTGCMCTPNFGDHCSQVPYLGSIRHYTSFQPNVITQWPTPTSSPKVILNYLYTPNNISRRVDFL